MRVNHPGPGRLWRIAHGIGLPAVTGVWALLCAPPLLFPGQVPHATEIVLGLAAVPAVAARWTGQRVWPRTPFTIPWILLVGTAAVAVLISPVPAVSAPKFAGIVLGSLVLRAVLLSVTRRQAVVWTASLYLLAGAGFVSAGLLGTDLNSKYLPSSVARHLPARFHDLPGTDGSVNANALGGTVLFFLPLSLALLTGARTRSRRCDTAGRSDEGVAVPKGAAAASRLALLALTAFLVSVLVLSQSLTAWLSQLTAAAIVVWLRWPRTFVWSMPAIALMALVLLTPPGRTGLWSLLPRHAPTASDDGGRLSVEARVELWSRAVLAIRDAPLTGIGLNSFRRVALAIYPPFLIPRDLEFAHAHNVFLQTALDVGLPGLIAYLALLLVATALCWRLYRHGGKVEASLAVGLWASLAATHLFGLTDAIALGAKVGVFLWWNLALIGALGGAEDWRPTPLTEPARQDHLGDGN